MHGKWIGALVTIAVVGVGAVLVLGGKSDDPAPPQIIVPSSTPSASASVSPQNGPTVRYNGTSFSPETVTIKVGQSVSFVNDSSAELVVASDPHPIHTNLGGFDSEENIAQGKAYVYTFTKVGSWGFHNHKKSSAKGRVIVE